RGGLPLGASPAVLGGRLLAGGAAADILADDAAVDPIRSRVILSLMAAVPGHSVTFTSLRRLSQGQARAGRGRNRCRRARATAYAPRGCGSHHPPQPGADLPRRARPGAVPRPSRAFDRRPRPQSLHGPGSSAGAAGPPPAVSSGTAAAI